jgi:hypothetical protein
MANVRADTDCGSEVTMPETKQYPDDRLTNPERLVAALAGAALLATALLLLVRPPQHHVALAQCRDASAGCIVSVDSDLSTFSAALAAIGALVALVGILGIRFNKFRVAGGELSWDYAEQTEGYSVASPLPGAADRSSVLPDLDEPHLDVVPPPPANASEPRWTDPERYPDVPEPTPSDAAKPTGTSPIVVEVQEGVGATLRAPALVPVATTRLVRPIREVDPLFLRDYQAAIRATQHSFFMTHLLGPAKSRGQAYSVAIRVSPHKDQDPWVVRSASFYLGRSWGSRVFAGQRGTDGKFGITTEAWGPFLALCEVEFDDGTRILLHHYCDFDMGSLLPA